MVSAMQDLQLPSQPKSGPLASTHFLSTEGRRLSWRDSIPQTVTHLSNNRAQYTATLLMRSTTLLLSQVTTQGHMGHQHLSQWAHLASTHIITIYLLNT